jgi:hypothetical protein
MIDCAISLEFGISFQTETVLFFLSVFFCMILFLWFRFHLFQYFQQARSLLHTFQSMETTSLAPLLLAEESSLMRSLSQSSVTSAGSAGSNSGSSAFRAIRKPIKRMPGDLSDGKENVLPLPITKAAKRSKSSTHILPHSNSSFSSTSSNSSSSTSSSSGEAADPIATLAFVAASVPIVSRPTVLVRNGVSMRFEVSALRKAREAGLRRVCKSMRVLPPGERVTRPCAKPVFTLVL